MSQLEQIFNKYITPFKNYAITCVREYQVYKTVNPIPVAELKQLLEENDENNDIIKILDEK